MGSAKRKSSFRIEDILHQQAENQLLAVQQQLHNSKFNSTMFNKLSPSLSSASSDSHQAALINMQRLQQNSASPSYPEQSISPSTTHSPTAEHLRKPTAFYPELLNLHKPNFQLPMPLGMHHFNPAAAYLEHYANVLHKGELISNLKKITSES
jgi:hypothetical protein